MRVVKSAMPILLTLALLTAESIWAQSADSISLEDKIREKLDRIFLPDQYLIDFQMADAGANKNGDNFLPGLELLGPVAKIGAGVPTSAVQSPTPKLSGAQRGDLLVLIDKAISPDRVKVADEIVKRILKGEGLQKTVRVRVAQQEIAKELPPPPPTKQEPSFLDQVEKNKDLLGRMFFVLWCAIVSIIAAYVFLKRISQFGTQTGREAALPRKTFEADKKGGVGSGDSENRKRLAASKDEIYSKDQAILTATQEVVGEAKSDAKKVAKILSRWVAQSEDNARYAALFLKNCDIKTIENVCSLLHPSDLEKILAVNVQDFDPFSEENQKVIERIRGDFALLAAEQLLKAKPDPLDFLRILSDEDIASVLHGETLDTVALVATQIPIHRLQKFCSEIPADTLNALLSKISALKSPTVEDFSGARKKLQEKTLTLSSNLFSDKARVSTITYLVQSVGLPKQQRALMDKLLLEDRSLYAHVRPQILLATDFDHLSTRMATVLTQGVDADVLAVALSGLEDGFENLKNLFPEAYRVIFSDIAARSHEDAARAEAWKKVSSAIRNLLSNGLMTQSEIKAAITLADAAREQKHGNYEEDAQVTRVAS